MNSKTYYEILDVDPDASFEEIKVAYRKKIKFWHPDKNKDNLNKAEEITKLINLAFEVLSDEKKRSDYDETLKYSEGKSFSKNYSENSLWEKFSNVALKAGAEVVYKCLQLYFVLKKPDVPVWAKAVITGALGYFILPIDAIPDLIPVAGFSDDLGAIVGAIGIISIHIDDEVNRKAKEKMLNWFKEEDLERLGMF